MGKRKAQPQESAAQKALRILEAMQFESLKSRIAAPATLPEYLRFLALKVACADFDATVLSPPTEIDAIWHAHILDTKHYRTTCDALGGTFIDHNPDGGADTAARDARLKASLAEYKKAFGTPPGCWSRAADRPVLAPAAAQPAAALQSQHKRLRSAPASEELDVGVSVQARFQATRRGAVGTRWFAGWIVKQDASGRFDIVYEDGDFEKGVDRKYIKVAPQKSMPAWATDPVVQRRAMEQTDLDSAINIKVVTQDGNEIFFKCKKTTALSKLMNAFCQRQGICRNSVRFLFEGERIREEQTPAELEMEDGVLNLIYTMLNQMGC